MTVEAVFVLLFAVATAVALLARWLKAPYTVALVLAGLGLGTAHAFEPPHLTKDLMYAVFLPGLLFEAAYHLEFSRFLQNRISILALAVPGLVASVLATAAFLTPAANALHFVEGFSFMHGLVFAALLAATDPIAVVAMFKSLGAPRRLAVIVEGESLLNDGTAVVVFTLILSLVTGGGEPDAGHAIVGFVTVVGMGLLVGAAIGFGVSHAIHKVDDPMIEITLTTIAAYGSFVAAESFHYSGVIATVAAGMLCGNHAARTGMSPSTRIAVESFWEYVAFALNSVVFLLIGFQVRVQSLVDAWKPILIAWLAVTAGRALVVLAVGALLHPTRERFPRAWTAVMTWGGLRGGLSMVLVLSLAPEFPHRELMITMTFGVVLVSILLQGLTMPALLRALKLTGSHEARSTWELGNAALRATTAALAELDAMSQRAEVSAEVIASLRTDYESRRERAHEEVRQLRAQQAVLRDEEFTRVRRTLLLAEKARAIDEHARGLVGQEAFEHWMRDLDARLVELDRGLAAHA